MYVGRERRRASRGFVRQLLNDLKAPGVLKRKHALLCSIDNLKGFGRES